MATATKPAVKAKPASKAPTYLDACQDLLQTGHAAVARERLEAFIQKQGATAAAYALLGQAHRILGDGVAAATAFRLADIVDPGYLPARLLHAEMKAGDGDLAGARALLVDTAAWHPTFANVLAEIAALTDGREDYENLHRLWLTARMKGMTSAAGARAVAKAACLVDAFEDARDIFRWLIRAELKRVREDKARNLVRPPKASTGRVEDGKGERALHDLKALLRGTKTPFFLISGTLLGYLREGRMLPGDKDIDIGIFEDDYDQKKLEKAFRRSPVFVVKRLDNSNRLRVAHVNGVWIDVFPHYREGDLIWHDGTSTRWSNTPFEIGTMTVDGEEYEIPQPPELYLDENYGDWRTPNGMFDVRYEAPNSQVTSQDYLSVLVYTKVFESLAANKWAVVEKYVADFPQLFRDDPVLATVARESTEITAHLARVQAARIEGFEPPVFPEAEAARREAKTAVKQPVARAEEPARPRIADPAVQAGITPAEGRLRVRPEPAPYVKKPDHIRVAKWFAKRWKRVFG